MDKGPTGNEKHIDGLYTLNGTSTCKTKIPEGFATEPKNEALDTAAKNYLIGITEISPGFVRG